MRALLLEQPLSIALAERAEPHVAPGEALVRVRSIGICGSDLHAYRGHHPFVTYPRVLGHELGCEILEVGPNERGLKAGDKVCVEPILNCGTCYPCRQGRYNCCTRVKVLGIHTDGGMTERISVPVDRLHKPPIDLDFDELALCETLSIGVQAVKRGAVAAGETVLVVGAGPIGLGAMIAAKARGARVLVSDPQLNNREVALAMGADAALDPTAGDLPGQVRGTSGHDDGGAHVVIEAVGAPATIAQTIELAAPTGRVVVVGISKQLVPIPITDLMRKEVALLTSRNSCNAFPTVLELFINNREALRRMITHRFNFSEAPRILAWMHASEGPTGVIKAVLTEP